MTNTSAEKDKLDFPTLALHLGITIFGTCAWLTGEWAGDYKKLSHPGFSLHKGLGICLALFILARLLYGLLGPEKCRWGNLIPMDLKAWFGSVAEDVQSLLKQELPDRPRFWGLKGVVQLFGLLVFSWMALSGSLLFTYLEPGRRAHGLLWLIKEMHEVGKILIPIFLALHLTGVLLDAIWGQKKWRRVIFLEK
ncbi:MAG: cytochrome b/b6 domain-containing protein [Thermodesulfobacteriota bacterium]